MTEGDPERLELPPNPFTIAMKALREIAECTLTSEGFDGTPSELYDVHDLLIQLARDASLRVEEEAIREAEKRVPPGRTGSMRVPPKATQSDLDQRDLPKRKQRRRLPREALMHVLVRDPEVLDVTVAALQTFAAAWMTDRR